MRTRRWVEIVTLTITVGLGLAGCGQDGSIRGARVLGPGSPDPSSSLASGSARTVGASVEASEIPTFDPGNFVSGVNHRYFPLVPGRSFTYVGETEEGTETTVVEILRTKKVILGIEATVVRDRVYLDGELIEDTFDWFAQDREGNVWYLGEDVKNYEDGVLVSTEGSWEAGKDGARAGIQMLAHPEVGDTYQQEYLAGVAEDMAKVKSLSETVTVPYGTFTQCLQTLEWTPLEPGARGYKYYAPGLGLVLETSASGGKERSELVSVKH